MKSRQIATLFTSLTDAGGAAERTDIGVSSLMDVWILMGNREANAERSRLLQIVKARGIAHSNQVREFVLTDHGLTLLDVYRKTDGRVVIGSARDAWQRAGSGDPTSGPESSL
jgi:circadian clock protein KaiC